MLVRTLIYMRRSFITLNNVVSHSASYDYIASQISASFCSESDVSVDVVFEQFSNSQHAETQTVCLFFTGSTPVKKDRLSVF